MDQVTQQNAANAEQSAAAAEELNSQAASMLDVVEDLMALVDGSAAAHEKQSHYQVHNGAGTRRRTLPMLRDPGME